MEFSSSPPATRRRFNLDEDEDELSIVEQSPYFTQPTQVVERPASRLPHAANSSPKSIVEVPASSPFRPQSLQQRGGRIANLMAPAGTAFRAPARQVLPIQKTAPKREFIMISDDELDAPIYAGGDSSDEDEQPSRGDIRPSSFQPKEPETLNGTNGAQLPGGRTVSSLQGTLSFSFTRRLIATDFQIRLRELCDEPGKVIRSAERLGIAFPFFLTGQLRIAAKPSRPKADPSPPRTRPPSTSSPTLEPCTTTQQPNLNPEVSVD